MRRLLLPLAILLVALAAAACAGSESPGWTYAPPTEPPAATPVPSGDASASPSAAPSEAPSDPNVVQISALNIEYEQDEVTAPADTAFTIHFNNKDNSVQHDVVIKDAGGMQMFKGDLVTGPAEIDYSVPALAAGTYTFVCSIHPNMVGTLIVGG